MSHVFISYARADQSKAQKLANALQKSRIPVWWDPKIALGERWEPALHHAIMEAAAVIVLWSNHSIHSEWVQKEAALAIQQGAMIPVRISPVNPPGPFGQYDCADLSSWEPSRPHREFDQLRRHLLTLFGGGGAWQVERLNRETLLVSLDVEQHTVSYERGHLFVDGIKTVEGLASIIAKRSFNFELQDGKRYYPARLDVWVTMLRGDVKRLSLYVGGTALYNG